MKNPCNHRGFGAVTLRMQREMQGNPDPCPWCEVDRLREVIARCYMRMQCADVPREPWHWEVCTTLDNTGIPSSHEPSGCPEHGLEHFFEGMCIKCGVVPAAKSNSGLYRHAWELLPGGSYRCLRCKTLCLEPHDANLCSLPPVRTNVQASE